MVSSVNLSPDQISLSARIITSDTLQESLDEALSYVNSTISSSGDRVEGYFTSAKEPIFLELVHQDGKREPIGVTHFAKLTREFEHAEFAQVARTIQELVTSIFTAIRINSEAKTLKNVLITPIGVPLYMNGVNITILYECIFIDGYPSHCDKHGKLEDVRASWLIGEEGLTFEKFEKFGQVVMKNHVDQRPGRGVFQNLNKDNSNPPVWGYGCLYHMNLGPPRLMIFRS